MARLAVPVRLEAMALLDSGAEVTCLDTKLVEGLQLPCGGAALANVPGLLDLTVACQFDASLEILHPSGRPDDNLVISDVSVLELPLNLIGYQAIIGRDVLARCLFLYNGVGTRFALKYS